MEFLKTCNTNAQAIGDFEAIAYQAVSIARTASPVASRSRDWPSSDDVRAVEAELRQALHWVTHDATRPWLWLFTPTTVDEAADQGAPEPPQLDGYRLQREQAGCIKAVELARPPMRAGNPNAATTSTPSSSAPAANKGAQGAGARGPQGQATTADHPPPDCFTLYELLTSSIVALISFHLVRDCSVVALNYRTFISRPRTLQTTKDSPHRVPVDLHWLTTISAHWTSSGTFLVSTTTQKNHAVRCLDAASSAGNEEHLIGTCVRVAPNGLLATVVNFDDPLESITVDFGPRQRKRARITTLEQSIAKWKSTVTRWLGWRGFALPDLGKSDSWVRIRTTQTSPSAMASPITPSQDKDILWPRALCFFYISDQLHDSSQISHNIAPSESSDFNHKWFETQESAGFRDPLDVAQEWSLGKPNRDRLLEAQRKAKKAEEEAARRKEEPIGLYPSSPLNTRTGVYGDLQAVSGVYPTPPDGIAPGTGFTQSDTPSVSGAASNIILAPGGINPAINLSLPQDNTHADMQEPLTSPVFPSASDNFHTSSGNDDLFGDMEEDGFNGDNINDDDFDFFDGPDNEDVDMLDAPSLPDSKVTRIEESEPTEPTAETESQAKAVSVDPFTALENALATASLPSQDEAQEDKTEQPTTGEVVHAKEVVEVVVQLEPHSPAHDEMRVDREPTPLLSPGRIANALLSTPPSKATSHDTKDEHTDTCRDKAFNPLNFSRKMSLADAKYQDGRFGSSRTQDTTDTPQAVSGPTQPKSLRNMPLMTKLRYAVSLASTTKIPEITALARAASDDSDSDSEASDQSEEESEEETDAGPMAFMSGLIMPTKRKLPTEGNATPMSVTSFADSFGGDWQDLHGLQLDEAYLSTFEPNSWDWSLTNSPSPLERSLVGARFSMPALPQPAAQMPDTPTSQPDLTLEPPDEKLLSGKDSIIIIQIVTDQVVSATLDILKENPAVERESTVCLSSETRWQSVIQEVFPDTRDCNIPALAAVHDVFPDFQGQAKSQQRPPPRKPADGTAIPGNHMYQINAPFLRVRRAETHWDLLPPAIAFWEPLGLSPASPPKNVIAFCIYPHSESIRPYLEGFLLNLQLAYDSCKLGSHARVETVVEFEGGLVPCKVTTPVTQREAFKILRETCIQLGKLLAIQYAKIREQHDSKIDAFVIYIVDPIGGPSALWELCASFWALFQAYGQGQPGRPDQPQKPDLVLQIVPMKNIASFDEPVILDPSTYINLAREVYDRCPPSAPSGDKTCLSIYTAPAFQLEETLPRSIPFKLLSEPPQDLLRENCYIHLGYAISLDGTWITAAWTDNCGKSQTVVSYHLGTRGFVETAKEIWQTTIEILQSRRVHWRVCIAKSGVMDREELETWVMLISCPTQINLFITLLTVDTEPFIKLTPSPPVTVTTTQPSANTPGSTPQAGVSPDPSAGLTPAATPSAEPSTDPSTDQDARLIDVTDETWGIILAHRLHNSNSTNQFSPALISGLLVKRGETFATSNSISHPIPDPEQGPIVIGVNILWIGAVGSTRAATSPFPPAGDGASPGGAGAYASSASSAPPSPSPATDGVRSTSSLMWTPTLQTRTTAENLLKEVLGQFRALGLLAKLRGMRGTRHGSVPWHIAAAKRGVGGLSRVMGGH